MSVRRVIGIDLGTTNVCVAVIDDSGAPRVLADKAGRQTTPSVVAFADEQQVLVGERAKRQAVTNAERTIAGAKRLIGRKVNTEEVTKFAHVAPIRIAAAANGDAWIRIDKQRVSPQEVAGHLLAHVRQIAEEALGEMVTRAVVTVPAHFDDAQRQATRDAGTIAGLDVLRILNEPTAAALAYGAHRMGDGRRVLVVFDLGGGTFDISIMAVDHGIFEVLATDGDSALGGADWNQRVIQKLADEVFDLHRVDVTDSPVALGRLEEAVEMAKKQLSGASETTIELPYLASTEDNQPIHLERRLSRAEFEELTADLRDQLMVPCQRALDDAGLSTADLDDVLLVGGMTRSPAIQTVVEQIFGRKPSKGANPDEVVALGAAAYAGILSGALDDAALLDVTPHDIGIKVGDSQFSVVIPRNSMLPVRANRVFATARDDQEYVHIEVYQGAADNVSGNRRLGHITLEGLPKGKAGSVRIELAMTLDVESILRVTATERSTGQAAKAHIRPSGGLSRKELVEIVTRRLEDSRRDVALRPTNEPARDPES